MKKIIVIMFLFFTTSAYSSEQMIEIAVEITEINENKAKDLGVKWTDEVNLVESNIPAIIESGSWQRNTSLSATIKALEENGAAKILSKPKLVTRSGTSANFMVGGEFPIVAAVVGATSVHWKKYGIIMDITPTVTRDNKIDIVINTELSKIDHSIDVCGYPGIIKRQASSHLQIRTGETIVLAGLIETTKEKIVRGIPFLCNIPFLGALFSSQHNVEKKTNVIIFVTPKLQGQGY